MLGFEFMTKLTPLEIQAVVAHERGHNWWHGFLKNVVSAFAPAFLPSITRRQELLADDYAKRQGLGLALASALLKFEHLQQKDYPPIQERVRRLRDGVTTQR
jgi:Zn-dependent protease with chaperone function